MEYTCKDCGHIQGHGLNKCEICGSIYLIPNKQTQYIPPEEKETLFTRLFSSIFLSFIVMVAIVLLPIFLMFAVGTKGSVISAGYAGKATLIYTFYTQTWLLYLLVISLVIGFFLGLKGTFTFIGHMFFIEKPANKAFSLLIWVVIIATGYFSYTNVI